MPDRVYTEDERRQLEQQSREGEWLSPGQVAAVLKIARSAVHNWLKQKQTPSGLDFEAKTKIGSKHRIVNPAHVVAVLDADREPAAE